MKLSKKLTIATLVGLSAISLTSCDDEVNNKKRSNQERPTIQRVKISPTANKAVIDLLPKGPNNFTIDSKLSSTEVHVSGYVNFDDCTTEASATSIINGISSSLRYINAGSGEAVSKDNQPFIDIISPRAESAVIITPMYVLQNTTLKGNGIACSISMLSELATVGSSNADGSLTLNWDYGRTDKFTQVQAKIIGEKTLKALGATDLDIAMQGELIQALFKVSPETVMRKTKFVLSKIEQKVTIKVYRADKDILEPMITYTFTPTSKVNVVPVPYKTWFEELSVDFKKSGKSFEEYIRTKG